MTNKENQTLLTIINHIINQHPDLAPSVEMICQSIRGKGEQAAISEWAARGYSAPAPHFIKQLCLLRNGFPNAIWVESGTYLGQTTEILSKYGSFVYSIEPEPELYENARSHFENYANVQIIRGLSEEVFPILLPTLIGDCNFWLDGHYSGGITHKGPQDTPILDELDCITKNIGNFKNLCVLIDDVRCFNPEIPEYSAYPALSELVVWALRNNLSWHIEHDIFVAKSKSTPPQP